jgi:hypothetical protein
VLNVNLEKNIERFENEFAKINREGSKELLEYLRKSDMYSAPGSTRFHLSVPGGLLQHSLNVLDALRATLQNNNDGTYTYLICGKDLKSNKFTITEENLIIIALLHDICKTRYYKIENRWKKDENNKWISYESYTTEDESPLGHGEKSCLMIQQFMKLEAVELYSIRWHMGFSDAMNPQMINTLSSAIDKFPIIWAMHNADMMASHFMEDTSENNSYFE